MNMDIKYKNILVARDTIEYIANNFVLTAHSKKTIKERFPGNIKNAMLNCQLAWYNTDDTMNIAINMFEYFVIGFNNDVPSIITFKGKSLNGISVIEKFIMASKGYQRK